MGFFDIFKSRKNKIILKEEAIVIQDIIDNSISEKIYNSSNIISNEIIDEIKKINDIEYISDTMMKKMEKYPKLVDLLLKGNISNDILILLNSFDKSCFLPTKEEDLKFIEFLDFDENTQKLVQLLNNRVNNNLIDNTYSGCYLDLKKEFETIDYHNTIESFIPNVNIELGSEILTKTASNSPFIIYFPKNKHKIVCHKFDQFITGDFNLDEDTVVQMSYSYFRYLDKSIINKISKCKIVFSDTSLIIKEDAQFQSRIDYKLIKCNHLIYVVEKSSLSNEIKEKLLYQIKSMYKDARSFVGLELVDIIILYLNNLSFSEIKKLTDEFELNIEIYKTKNIEKPEFNASFYIDGVLPNFKKASVEDVINIVKGLPLEFRHIFLKDPRVSRKLNLPDNLGNDELKKIGFLLTQRLSSTTIDFINSLDFDVVAFMNNQNNDYYSSSDINWYISKYGVFDCVNEEMAISVADLIGHDAMINCGEYKGKNILYTFENFFEKGGDEYRTRSLGLLGYKSGEQLISELERRNHDIIDMRVTHMENGKYIISGNGLHRFTVLRFHYLLDCMKNERSEDELYELYKIPVKFEQTANLKKTYCNYFIRRANPHISHISFNNGQDEIRIYYKSEKTYQVIDEEKLVYLAIQSIDMLVSDGCWLDCLKDNYNEYDSLREFIDKYKPDLFCKSEEKKEGIGQR